MNMEKLKEIFKNKKFLLVLVIVIILGLYMYFRNKSQGTAVVSNADEGVTGSYGGGTDSYTPQSTASVTPAAVPVAEPITSQKAEKIDNGITDKIEQVTPKLDANKSRQEASNQIYDLKDLWTSTSKAFGENPTNEQAGILEDIHQKAQGIATQAGLGSGGEEGRYPGLMKDTRNYNAITGESSFHPGEEILTTAVKNQRIAAQTEINSLKQKYSLTADTAEQERIHNQAEKIGIEAGLGVGGESGSGRKTVNLKTGAFE